MVVVNVKGVAGGGGWLRSGDQTGVENAEDAGSLAVCWRGISRLGGEGEAVGPIWAEDLGWGRNRRDREACKSWAVSARSCEAAG